MLVQNNERLSKSIRNTITINECDTSKKCYECYNNLDYYRNNFVF